MFVPKKCLRQRTPTEKNLKISIVFRFFAALRMTKKFSVYIQPLGFGKPAILAAFFTGPLGNN